MAANATFAAGIDLYSDATLSDPYPVYRRLRAESPVVYVEQNEVWAVTHFSHLREVLRDWQRFSSAEGVALNGPVNEALTGTVLSSDPPQHTKLRRVLSQQLSPGAMASLEEKIGRQADELVAGLVERGEFDAVEDLAAFFPISIVADLIGLPQEGREKLIAWGNAIFDGFGPDNARTREALPMVQEMYEYLGAVATRDRLAPGSMGMAVYEAADRGEIDAESCVPLMSAYVAAGMDTTINATGTGAWLLATHPDQWEKLRSDPDLVRSAGNEILRFDSPVQAFTRVTTDVHTVGDVTIPAGERVYLGWGAANRDEAKWEAAEEFDIARNPIDHLGFGHGIHRCAGAALARVEIEAIFSSLARRAGHIEVTGPVERRLNNTVRGLRKLPISVQPC